jgi:hypothetical protein
MILVGKHFIVDGWLEVSLLKSYSKVTNGLKTICAYYLYLFEDISMEIILCRFYCWGVRPKSRINFYYRSMRILSVD